jgi:tRNA dimethylallyltransferase
MSGKAKRVVFILGPTATGKSKLALRSSLVDQIPIINGDSIQVFKGLKIGSATPGREDLKITPHYLYSHVEKGRSYTAANLVADVDTLLKQHKNEARWILCGGSGFYIQALEKGMFPVTAASPEVKSEAQAIIEEKGWDKTYEWILAQDKDLQKKIHLNDHYRITRALEILLISEKSHGQLQGELRPSPFKDFTKIKVGLSSPKSILREKVIKRVHEMLAEGFIEEVEGLLQEGLGDWAPLSSVGYREVKAHLLGEIPPQDLADHIVQSHMQLIKKQMTWFKRDENIHWFDSQDPTSAYEFIQSQWAQT